MAGPKKLPRVARRARSRGPCFHDHDGVKGNTHHPQILPLVSLLHRFLLLLSCIVELHTWSAISMAYIAPIHRPSSIRHALKLSFLAPNEDCLVVA